MGMSCHTIGVTPSSAVFKIAARSGLSSRMLLTDKWDPKLEDIDRMKVITSSSVSQIADPVVQIRLATYSLWGRGQ
jgi:hypothetical protein